MPRIYELPTHLEVEDVLIAGLTARQLVRLLVGASLAYGVWDQVVWLPDLVRVGLAAAIAVAGLLIALVQPGGRSLDQWLLAALVFVALPRRLTWRSSGALGLACDRRREQSGWAELPLQAAWPGSDADAQEELRMPVSRMAHVFGRKRT
jgi:hypothetical protein